MKKRRFGLLLNIAVLCLCVCAIAIGVYSVKNAQLNVTGTIGFQAHNCKVRIKATVDGYASTSSLNTNAITGTNGITVGQTSADSSYSWDVGTLIFDDMDTTIKKPVKDIVFTFTVTNLSDFYIDYEVNRECINNSRIRIYNPNQGATLAPASVVGNGATEGESLTFTVALQLLADSEGKYTDLNNFTFNASELVKFYKSQAPAFLLNEPIEDHYDSQSVLLAEYINDISSDIFSVEFVNELKESYNLDKDTNGEYKAYLTTSVTGTSESGTAITSPSSIASYYSTIDKKVYFYSPGRIYAPQDHLKYCNGGLLGFYNSKTILLNNFDTSLVTNMERMFDMSSVKSWDLLKFDTSNVVNMRNMFGNNDVSGFGGTSLDLSQFNTSNVENMSGMFAADYDKSNRNLISLDLSNFNTSKVTNMSYMFDGQNNLSSIDFSEFDTSNVVTMSHMFAGCGAMTELDLSSFDTRNVKTMGWMFYNGDSQDDNGNCNSKITKLNISNFNTENVTEMTSMFSQNPNLIEINLSSFDTSNVTEITSMFGGCSKLKTLDLSTFSTAKVTTLEGFLSGCTNLTTIYVSDLWTTISEVSGTVFNGCSNLVGGAGTVCDGQNNIGETYARIDGGTSAPGYFTAK